MIRIFLSTKVATCEYCKRWSGSHYFELCYAYDNKKEQKCSYNYWIKVLGPGSHWESHRSLGMRVWKLSDASVKDLMVLNRE
ncbi:hypothetical protein RIR_jg13699.t1 [Rhizophagus irregularis DAOM 181602=DAOM 197198]|nr:hypothetical protein RIR_jg13699.t1 [Rhizophagus irregularis DAOM 181602=DAOM 197198]